MTYEFDEAKYQYAKANKEKIAWEDFANGREDFPDYHNIANPHLIRDSEEHTFWETYFNKLFGKECTFPFIVRLINSFMITGEPQRP